MGLKLLDCDATQATKLMLYLKGVSTKSNKLDFDFEVKRYSNGLLAHAKGDPC